MQCHYNNSIQKIDKRKIDKINEKDRKRILKILGIPSNAIEYNIVIKEIEYWTDNK